MIGASAVTKGGLPNAFLFAAGCGCEAIQLYVTSSRTWVAADLHESTVTAFASAWSRSSVRQAIAHASLLLNLASSDNQIWTKSIQHLVLEIRRSHRLGISSIVVHAGSNPDRREGLQRVVEALDLVTARTSDVSILLETVAGQGNTIGYRFEELRLLLDGVTQRHRFGICFDTCHVFAAGYDLRGYAGYDDVFSRFDDLIGIEEIKAFHVNDSRAEIGRRVDRHADMIGEGHIGLHAFHALVRDRRFQGVPKIAEVPDGGTNTRSNVELLKRLRVRDDVLPPDRTAVLMR
jgi:deoxyribonuclease-4